MDSIIRFENVSKSFGANNDVHALNNISLDIERGSIFGIIGMSGAGKSTLIRVLNFLERPNEGTVFIDGEDLSKLKKDELRKKRQEIAMIFQQFNLLTQKSVIQNVCLPMLAYKTPKAEAMKRAMQMLEVVGLSDKKDAYPSELSGGQRQRVAIARAIAYRPKILLCDEATSALDPNTTDVILDTLKEINEKYGITIVLITHSMSVVERICDKVAILDKGKIAETGNVKEIFENPKSPEGKKLILNDVNTIPIMDTPNCVRITFTETSSFEPVIANMTLTYKTPVNILYANTATIGKISYGEMILQLPSDNTVSDQMINYLRLKGHTVERINIREVIGNA